MTQVNTPQKVTKPKLATTEEVAELLRVSSETVTNMARRGDIPFYRASRKTWRYNVDEVLAAIGR